MPYCEISALRRGVIALRLDAHEFRQQHAHALAHLVVVLHHQVDLAVALDRLDGAGLLADVVDDELRPPAVVFLNGVARGDFAQLHQRGARLAVVGGLGDLEYWAWLPSRSAWDQRSSTAPPGPRALPRASSNTPSDRRPALL